MNTKLEKALDNFSNEENQADEFINFKSQKDKKIFLNQKEDLIERVNKTFVVADGRQLLREVLREVY